MSGDVADSGPTGATADEASYTRLLQERIQLLEEVRTRGQPLPVH